MKKWVAAMTVFVSGIISVSAQNGGNPPCFDGSTNRCGTEPSIAPLPIIPNPIAVCVGEEVSACNTYTNIPGELLTDTTNSSTCEVTTSTNAAEPSVVTYEWFVVSGLVSSNGSGSCVSFFPTNCGTGSITFFLTYTNPGPCTNVATITNSVAYKVNCSCDNPHPVTDTIYECYHEPGSTNCGYLYTIENALDTYTCDYHPEYASCSGDCRLRATSPPEIYQRLYFHPCPGGTVNLVRWHTIHFGCTSCTSNFWDVTCTNGATSGGYLTDIHPRGSRKDPNCN